MTEANRLIAEVGAARVRAIESVAGLTLAQAAFKPLPEAWSVNENLEHLVLAEISGVSKIWQALHSGKIENTNHGLSIEEIVARTWKPKEITGAIAAPHIGGPLHYWITCFRALQPIIEELGCALGDADLASIGYPHFLCGPLDARQRLEFLRFHIERHTGQIERLKLSLPRS